MSVQESISDALQHLQAGRLNEAEKLYESIAGENSNVPDTQNLRKMLADALNKLGVELRRKGQLDESVAALDRAIRLAPESPDPHCNKGSTLRDQRRFGLAIAEYSRAIQLDPRMAAAHTNLANVLVDLGQFEQAVASYQKSLQIKPDDALTLSHLANALRELGRLEQALAAVQESIRIKPDFPLAYECLGNVYHDSDKYNQAIDAFNRALELNPTSAMAYNNIGAALAAVGKTHEAVAACSRAIELNPHHFKGFFNLGSALAELGQYDAAAAAFRRAIEIQPDAPDPHWNLSFIHLTRGEFERGWAEHEWRANSRQRARPRRFSQPLWHGEDLHGKRIILHSEQGFGDAIQFVRYVPLVAARGGKILLACPPELISLFRQIPEAELPVRDELPPFDCHCPLMSLPRIFGTRLHNIPAKIPYLTAPPELASAWKSKIDDGGKMLRVGLAWAGNPKHKRDRWRSVRLEQFAPLATASPVRFYSLQKGDAELAGATPPAGMELIDPAAQITDFADGAALVENLDLVICVDTAVAHLAGALGKPVWLLVPFVPDWRWMLDRNDSPWYPTMRLFRQTAMDDWNSPIAQVAKELAELASKRK